MTQVKMSDRLVCGTGCIPERAISREVDWRTKRAMSDGRYRLKGKYDIPATGRRLLRILERQLKKGVEL